MEGNDRQTQKSIHKNSYSDILTWDKYLILHSTVKISQGKSPKTREKWHI